MPSAVITRHSHDSEGRLRHHALVVGRIPSLPDVLSDLPSNQEVAARCERLRREQHAFLQVLASLGDGIPAGCDLRVVRDPSASDGDTLRIAVVERASSLHSAADARTLAERLWEHVGQAFPPSYEVSSVSSGDAGFLDSIVPDRDALDGAQVWELRKTPYRVRLGNNVVEVVGTYPDHLESMLQAWNMLAEVPARTMLVVRCIPVVADPPLAAKLGLALERIRDDALPASSGNGQEGFPDHVARQTARSALPLLEDARVRLRGLLGGSHLLLLRVQLASWAGDAPVVRHAIQSEMALPPGSEQRGCECQWYPMTGWDLERARDDLACATADHIGDRRESWFAAAHEMVSATEASALWRLPIPTSRYAIQGISVRAAYPTHGAATSLGGEAAESITLGTVSRARGASSKQQMPIDDLRRHVLIAGEVGSGKSTTTQSLVWQLWEAGVPSLVIDPVSSEYADLWRLSSTFREGERSLCLFPIGAGETAGQALAFNPLCPQPGTSINAHIESTTTAVAAALELPESWRELVRSAIRAAYRDFGWPATDPVVSNRPLSREDVTAGIFPTLVDVIKTVEREILKYRGDFRSNAEAGLLRRLRELLYGPLGSLIAIRRPLDVARLVQHPAIVELRHLGQDNRAKSLCMLFLLTQLREYYDMVPRRERLSHFVVIEEAHRLLSPGVVNPEIGTNARAEAVGMFADMLAELRKPGIGLAIVEQLPTRLEEVIAKLPVTKILHRLTASDDRDMMARAMNMTVEQARYVATMQPGEAMVYAEGLREPLLLRMANPWSADFNPPGRQPRPRSDDEQRRANDEAAESTRRNWPAPSARERPWNLCVWCGCDCQHRMRTLESGWWKALELDDDLLAAVTCARDDSATMRRLATDLWDKVSSLPQHAGAPASEQKHRSVAERKCGLILALEECAQRAASQNGRPMTEPTIDRLLDAMDTSR